MEKARKACASVAYSFIGTDEAYWTDYVILPANSGMFSDFADSTEFDDVFADEVQLVKVPTFALGLLRAQHKLGLSRRPDGPLPESLDAIEGRRDILPTMASVGASMAAPPDMQITMMNYLEYKPSETGAKDRGRRTYKKYGLKAMKAVHQVGGQFLFAGRISDVIIEAKNESMPGNWDDLAAMIYPDPMAIFYMEQSPDYRSALQFRDESLERTIVIATETY